MPPITRTDRTATHGDRRVPASGSGGLGAASPGFGLGFPYAPVAKLLGNASADQNSRIWFFVSQVGRMSPPTVRTIDGDALTLAPPPSTCTSNSP